MRQVGLGDCRGGGTGAGFEGVVGEAVDAGFERFVVRAPAYVEGGGVGPFLGMRWVWVGVGGDAGGFAVGEEGRVGGDVGDDVVEVALAVGEDAGGGEGLEGGEGGGEGSGWGFGGEICAGWYYSEGG